MRIHNNHNRIRHSLVCLHEGGLVDEALVYVECGHVVHDDGALEVLGLMLGLQDVLQQRGLARTQEPAQQRHRQQGLRRQSQIIADLYFQ